MTEVALSLGPSGAERWLKCSLAPRFEKEQPRTGDDQWALEGTMYHEVAEFTWRCTLHQIPLLAQGPAERALRDRVEAAGFSAAEMFAGASSWRNAVREVHDAYFTDWLFTAVEMKLPLDDLHPTMRGMADFVGVFDAGSGPEVLVSDLKAGTGVPVRAFENSQLKLYAYGAVQTLDLLMDLGPGTPVHVQVAQIRVENGVSNWATTVEELTEWVDTVVRPAIAEARDNPVASPGKWCQFCRAGAVCRSRAELAEGATELEPYTLSTEEMAGWLDKADNIRGFLRRVEERATADLMGGQEVPGWTLKRTNGFRKIVDQSKASEALIAAGFRQSTFIKPMQLLGVTALDGLVGGKSHLAELLGDSMGVTSGSIKLTRGDDGVTQLIDAAFPDDDSLI